jgi:streptogramin lyase
VWFTELAAHQIGVFDPATERFREFPLPGDELHPYWLAVGNDGRVWFTVLTAPFVGVLDPAGGEIAVLRVPGVADRYGTTGIAVADDGAVWFGIRGGQLGRVDPVALTITTFPSPGDDAYGVAAGGNGLVWLATTGDEIYAFNPQAETFCPLKTGGNAWWVTAAADGSIWVAEGTRGAGVLGRVSAARAAEVCPAP